MTAPVLSHRLEQELIKRHLVPDGCRFLSVEIEVGRPITMRFIKYPNAEELGRLGEALSAAAGSDT